MVFSSLVFLFAFLPCTLALYVLASRRWKNAVLFGVSLIFYGWGEPIYIFLMLGSILSAYLFGFAIFKHRTEHPGRAKLFFVLSVGVNLSALFFVCKIIAAFVDGFRYAAVSSKVYFRFKVAQEVGLEVTH